MEITDALKTLFEKQQAIDISLADVSDGYHTFAELYHHRAILFSVIVREHKDAAWKSKRHHDGTMYDNMFIVGVNTPDGQATYHYDIDPYWDMFDCRELEYAPEWDGHTPDDAIARIAKLEHDKCSILYGEDDDGIDSFWCSECGCRQVATFERTETGDLHLVEPRYCQNCGREVQE